MARAALGTLNLWSTAEGGSCHADIFLYFCGMSGGKWVEPIEEFSLTRRNLPHMQAPGSYYFTASNTWHRRELDDWERDLIFETILLHREKKYLLDAAVVMPDHFHLILKPLPKQAGAYYSLAEIFHSIKSYSAKQIAARDRVVPAALGTQEHSDLGTQESAAVGGSRHAKKIRVFQDENYDHIIRNERDYIEKLQYLIMNPVEAGLVERPEDYRWLYCPALNRLG